MTTAGSPATRVGEFVGGKYHILRVLAEGGMGVVYEAQHAVVKRRFAVKFLRADLAARREILTRFHREAQAAGALESENIAAAIDFGILDDGTPYIVMEYLVGESLGSLLARETRLPFARAADLCVQACRGMEAAHAAGIVHRDLKPENLFVCRREDGTDLVKVLDFGIAKLEQIESHNAATRTGTVLGTPAYMSPEQARGEKTIDHRTDVYGLAAILFEMLSGRKPHPGDSHNAILHHISTQPAVSLQSVEPDLPADLVETVQRALSSDPEARHPSAKAFAQELAPFVKRETWPTPAPAVGAVGVETLSTPGERLATPPRDPAAVTVDPEGPTAAAASSLLVRARRRTRAALIIAVTAGVVVASTLFFERGRLGHSPTKATAGDRSLAKDTRFFVPPPPPGAVHQIAELVKQKAFVDAARLTAMEATPQAALWLTGGTPEDVRGIVQNTVVRAAPDHRVPIFVANNIPFRDCAQYSAGGATDGAAYQAWVDGVATGIGNARAVIILEPDSLGIIPYATTIDGAADWCRPTVSDAQGRTVPAPGATPAERFAVINYAVDSIASKAPHAAVYLDGTHAGWLPVAEIAQRLMNAGVERAQGFFVNVANFQPTAESIQVATWISKCIYYANHAAEGGQRGRTRDCASQFVAGHPGVLAPPTLAEKWYVDHVDRAPDPPSSPTSLTHFVVDTSRNGRGRFDASRFAAAPYNQPPDVIERLFQGGWCNTPDAGLGIRPSVNTGVPLADAFLWVKNPGSSDGSCDIAGGARAWDYARYNPWGITEDAQTHFDPLWGTVDPASGEWFAEQAFQLMQNANPPLPGPGSTVVGQTRTAEGDTTSDTALRAISDGDRGEKTVGADAPIAATIDGTSAVGASTSGTNRSRPAHPVARPAGRPAGRPIGRPGESATPAASAAHAGIPQPPATGATASRPIGVSFDPKNPYGN